MNILIDKIKNLLKEKKLTPKEIHIARYIINNVNEAAELNLQELAEKSNTSTGTVLRFSQQKLNLSGFSELKERLIEEKSVNSYGKETEVDFEEEQSNLYKNITAKILNKSFENITNIIEDYIHEMPASDIVYIYDAFLEQYDNLVIFDQKNEFGHMLSNLLKKQNFIHHYENNLELLKNKLESCKNNLNQKLAIIKEISTNNNFEKIKSYFPENKLIIINFNNDKSINQIVNAAKNSGFTILLITNKEIKNKNYEHTINIGDTKINHPFNSIKTVTPYLFLDLMSVYWQNKQLKSD
ncbi:MAG: MurR/RpiR family transcriptional regulator [archaeon]